MQQSNGYISYVYPEVRNLRTEGSASNSAVLRSIHNYPIVPEESPVSRRGPILPVTRADLGVDFRNGMYFSFWHGDIVRQVHYDARLASFLWTQWYDNVEVRDARADSSKAGTPVSDWEEMAAYHAKRGLFVIFNSLAASEISKVHHERILDLFGPLFLGHNEGEWDGYYVANVAGGLDPNRSRREACEHYFNWMQCAYARHHHRMVTTSSLIFGCHYAAELGSRMLGLELGESLPCDTLSLAFCRGACKQYDLLMQAFPSVFSTRGIKCYPINVPSGSVAIAGYVAGPEHGTTLGLLKRLWWCSYMNGASLVGLQFGYFPTEIHGNDYRTTHHSLPMTEPVTEEKVKAHFTPLGWLFHELRETARLHPLRGVPYIPIALMLDHDHGWYPHPNIYARDRVNCVWGNIPYNRGDYQVDKFFQWVYPGYSLANSNRDERGKMVNTPFGDSFDVILNNAQDSCLAKYQMIILLGSWNVSDQSGLGDRLEQFVRNGGAVVADSSRWSFACQKSALMNGQQSGREEHVTHFSCGQGTIIRVSAPAWGADQDDRDIFETVKVALEGRLRELSLIQVEGRPIYYLVNVTDQPDELIVTLCNNSPALSWEGRIQIRGQKIIDVEEWLAYGEIDLRQGVLYCGIPANDVRIFRLKTALPFLPLRFRNIPWRSLGVGTPECS